MAYLRIVSSEPQAGATGVSRTVVLKATFDQRLYANTVSPQNVQLLDARSNVVPSTIVYNDALQQIVLTPTNPLKYSASYTFFLRGDPNVGDPVRVGILSVSYTPMDGDAAITFTVEAEPVTPEPPTPTDPTAQHQALVSSTPASGSILIPVDFETHDHKMTLNFAYPVSDYLSAEILTSPADNLADWRIAGHNNLVTTPGSRTKLIDYDYRQSGSTHSITLRQGATIVATGQATGTAPLRIYFKPQTGHNIAGSVQVTTDGIDHSGQIRVDKDDITLYQKLAFTGVNCIGLFGPNFPEITGRFLHPNIQELPNSAVTPENTVDIIVRTGTPNTQITLEFGHYIEDPEHPGSIIWENYDLPKSYQYILTLRAGIGTPYVVSRTVYPMATDTYVWFTTIAEPMYTTIQTIRLNIGAYIRSVSDDTIARLIYEVSWLVRQLYYEQNGIWLPLNDISRVPANIIQYVICKVKLDALDAAFADYTGTGSGVEKALGDFRVSRQGLGGNPLEAIRKKYLECLDDTGRATGIDPNRLVVRTTVFADTDPRRPITDESWRRWPKVPTILNQNGTWPATTETIARNLDGL